MEQAAAAENDPRMKKMAELYKNLPGGNPRKHYVLRTQVARHGSIILSPTLELGDGPSSPEFPPATDDPEVQQFSMSAQGQGSGWNTAGGDVEDKWDIPARFHYSFVPNTTRLAVMTITLNITGKYRVCANDDWWDWQNAHLSLHRIVTMLGYPGFAGFSDEQEIFGDGGAKLHKASTLDFANTRVISPLTLIAGTEIKLGVEILANVEAQGGSGHSEMDVTVGCMVQVSS